MYQDNLNLNILFKTARASFMASDAVQSSTRVPAFHEKLLLSSWGCDVVWNAGALLPDCFCQIQEYISAHSDGTDNLKCHTLFALAKYSQYRRTCWVTVRIQLLQFPQPDKWYFCSHCTALLTFVTLCYLQARNYVECTAWRGKGSILYIGQGSSKRASQQISK